MKVLPAYAQDSAVPSVSLDMEPAPARLTSVETVSCLGCGKLYAKPRGRGTLSTNPGCPECGYVGWLPTGRPFNPASSRDRFGEDPLPRQRRRSG